MTGAIIDGIAIRKTIFAVCKKPIAAQRPWIRRRDPAWRTGEYKANILAPTLHHSHLMEPNRMSPIGRRCELRSNLPMAYVLRIMSLLL